MRLDDWRILAALYDAKNLTAAARTLYITQPALTARLRTIESDINISIAHRSNKGTVFTPEGEYLCQNARALVEMSDNLVRRAQQIKEQNGGLISLWCPSTFARYFLPEIIETYNSKYPRTTFQFSVGVSSEICSRFNSGDIYCGIAFGFEKPTEEAVCIGRQNAFLVSQSGGMDAIKDLRTPLIMHNKDKSTKDVIMEWYKSYTGIYPEIMMSVQDVDTCLAMVSKGLGVTVVFGDFFREAFSNLCLTPISYKTGNPISREIWFMRSSGMMVSPCFNDFVRYITEELPPTIF